MTSKIDTPAKRNKLPIAKKPAWERLAPGVFLGYRKSPEARKWLVRYHDPDAPKGASNPYKMQVFANADDAHVDEEALSFKHASVEALKLAEAASVPSAKGAHPLTVRRAVEEYIAVRNARERKNKGRVDIRSDADTRLSRNVLSDVDLCDTKLKDTTRERLLEWLDNVPLQGRDEEAACRGLQSGTTARRGKVCEVPSSDMEGRDFQCSHREKRRA
ncbi:hypothetical protein [Rhizobium gallicum]|uniref:hypothetical protein n=1 Tax=Rhizobium gallicum TaxID=56730 RepID=UPI001EF91F18|nr:hypothetical protein [Rhizobium gallicum]ULJ70645.1 hypothetical protein L2W42_11805 [Rhizobium gallicum]